MKIERIGNCKLYCGDCLEILPTLFIADAIITDPPYGTTNLEWDNTKLDLSDYWNAVKNIRKENAVIVMFSQQPFTTDLINSNRKEFRYEIVWKKSMITGFLDANVKPLRAHENIDIFTKCGQFKASTYNPQKTESVFYKKKNGNCSKHYGKSMTLKFSEGTSRFPLTVIDHKQETSRNNSTKKHPDFHPTQKPVGLMQWLVNTYSNEGDLVLDPFMGSGTTGVACVKTGRRFIGIELNQKYFDIACNRIREAVKGVNFIEGKFGKQKDNEKDCT